MNLKRARASYIIFFTFLFLFLAIPPLQAAPQWYRNFRITITPQRPASYLGANAEFQANPTYMQGEQAAFRVTFTYEAGRGWIRFRMPVYIPQEFIRATFPNSETEIRLNHLFWGYYTYTSPVLTEVGNNNHTLDIVVYYKWCFSVFGRTYKIAIPMGIARKNISVVARPVDIEITSPVEGAVVNTNPLHVEGAIDDNSASVTVEGTPAVVGDNQFSAEVNLEEGPNLITAVAENGYGNTDSDSINVTLDTIPPQNPSINIEEGDYTSNRLIHLNLSAEGAVEMMLSEEPDFIGAEWEAYSEEREFSLSEGDDDKTIYVKYKDFVGNETGAVSDSIILDTTLPELQIISPENNLLTGQVEIDVSGTFIEQNLDNITINGIPAIIEDSTFTARGVPLGSEGENVILVVITDSVGHTSSQEINIIRDTIPPQNPGIDIDGGEYTNNTTVTLALSADDATEMIISEDPLFSGADWEAYTASRAFILSDGDGDKTVYVKYRDVVQNETAYVSDTITLDATIPQIQINTPNDGLFTNEVQVDVSGTFAEANLAGITVNDIAAVIDGNSFSVEGIRLDNEGENIIRAEIMDLAQNSNVYEITVTRDTIPPQISNISIVEADPVSNPLIHILLDVLGADQMMVSEDVIFSGVSWEDYVPVKEFTLSPGLGLKNIFFKFKDMAGNETGIIGRSITLARPESQGLVRVIGRQLLVNDEPYIIKGVTYQPTPIGVGPGNPNRIYTTGNCDRDLALLRDMGCNTIRTYSRVNQTLLDKAQEYGIRVCAGFWVNYNLNFSDPIVRDRLISSFRDYVEEFKDHPALLIWVIGNEQNNQNGNNPDWYSLSNEMAGAAKTIEGEAYHPAAITNGELRNIDNPDMLADDGSLNNIDIWGVNVYVGYSFTNYFSRYAGLSSKPLWISEYGVDAYDNVHNIESQKRQAAWNTHNWEEIAQSDVCIGATLMSYSDEWWKAGNAFVHNNGGFSTNSMSHPDNQPDRFLNEEWWGIVAVTVSDNGVNPDVVIPRMAYFSLKKEWSGQADPIILQDNLPGGTFRNNGTCSYIYDEVGQFLSISYDVTNPGSYSGYYALLDGFDSRPYNSVNLSVRGQNGGEQFKLGLRDQNGNEAKINVSEYLPPNGVTDSWQNVIIPLTSFGNNVDIGNLANISITFKYAIASGSGTIYIDNIGFGGDLPPLIQSGLGLTPWIHQIGDSVISYEMDPSGIVISYTVSGGTSCRLGMGLNRIDVSPYENLSFSVRGDYNGQRFHVYLEDFWHNRAYVEVQDVTTDWQIVSISLDPFVFQGIDITNLINLEIVFEWENRSGIIYLDDVQFSNP